MEAFQQNQGAAVLFSGGLDSAVLLAAAARRGRVQPVYIAVGFAWEAQERAMVDRLLASTAFAGLPPLVTLDAGMRDVYPASHWARRGVAPAYETPDAAVYIEGRNIVLLAKVSVFMARAGLTRILIGPLAGNPFPDASARFFAAMGEALSIGLGTPIAIEAPLAAMDKAAVIRLGASLGVPLERTLSCMQPANGYHCGRCSKCRERIEGFRAAGMADPTTYAATPPA